MGCDIHMHVEVKINGRWEHYAAPHVEPWYKLFGLLAGVRGEGPPLVEPRGMPVDASLLTALCYEYERDDAHSASWLDTTEIDQLRQWLNRQRYIFRYTSAQLCDDFDLERGVLSGTYLLGNSITDLKDTPMESVRLVFWFDN